MKIVFSRKGFDSAAGGCPSPLVDGRPISLPIPTKMPSPTSYGQLRNGVAEIVQDLTNGRHGPSSLCHLDPDLDSEMLLRSPGWRGAFGQVGNAQSHLANNGVGHGDLFLFWGLFRPAQRDGDRWIFVGDREHRLFGWLQVETVIRVDEDPAEMLAKYPWLSAHPHARKGWPRSNTIYIARDSLMIDGRVLRSHGWGMFKTGTRLTAPDSRKASVWSVADWLNPLKGGTGMTFHPRHRWWKEGVQSAARGQEFVADARERMDAIEWLTNLFNVEDDGKSRFQR